MVLKLFSSGQSPMPMLLLSVIVGVLAGLLSTTLELAIDFLAAIRIHWFAHGQWASPSAYLPIIFTTSLLGVISFLLVNRFAPEAKGSGIQEIEGVLAGVRHMRWRRVIPVKFFGGIAAIGSGMVLGREGPSVQMGGGVGQMIHDLFRRDNQEEASILIAAGSAAGLAAAFNAPLAAIVFVIEEMREEFRYNTLSIKSVIIGAVISTVVYRMVKGQESAIVLTVFDSAPLESLPLFFVLGGLSGLAGLLFNSLVLRFLNVFDRLTNNKWQRCLMIGGILGVLFGALTMASPFFSGDGIDFIPALATGRLDASVLFALFFARLFITLVCFCSGAPGGFFAPMLVLGTLLGTGFGMVFIPLLPPMDLEPGMFAIAGMVGLFAAAVRAPITGLVLVVELTGNYSLILPLLCTLLGAIMTAQALGGEPIYTLLLQRVLNRDAQKQAQEAVA